MLKCSSDRCVCAPHSLLLGTSTSPRLSVCLRTPITFTLLIALITFSFSVYPQFPGTVVPELRCWIDRDRTGDLRLQSNGLRHQFAATCSDLLCRFVLRASGSVLSSRSAADLAE